MEREITTVGTPTSIGKRRGLDPQALKLFRSNVAKLKRKGIVSKRVDARGQKATRYMTAKVRKFADVLEGRAIAVPAKKAIRQQYTDLDLLEERGHFLIAPKEFEHQRASIKRGLVQITRPLKNGREEYVILPFKPANMEQLVERLKADPTLDGLKLADEYFSFRIGENNSAVPFLNTEEMADYMMKYTHLFRQGQKAIRLITFQRFKTTNSEFMKNPHESLKPKIPYDSNRDARNGKRAKGTYELQRDRTKATRKAKQREMETPEQRNKRLAEQRRRSARNRQRKFEDE